LDEFFFSSFGRLLNRVGVARGIDDLIVDRPNSRNPLDGLDDLSSFMRL
jgi:hypothetical protein